MTRPRLLDLFCCAGCAADGYHRAGFDVVGVDIEPQPNYPFEFEQADALAFIRRELRHIRDHRGAGYAAVHASPPCHDHSVLAKRSGNLDGTGWLLAATRHALRPFIDNGIPVVIENVIGADMRRDLLLCGTMFPGLRVRRHRHAAPRRPRPEHADATRLRRHRLLATGHRTPRRIHDPRRRHHQRPPRRGRDPRRRGTRHRTTGRLYLATCRDGCPLMLWAEEAVTDPTQARRAPADATGTTPQGIDVELLDRPDARRHYRALNLTPFRQGCTHRPIRTTT